MARPDSPPPGHSWRDNGIMQTPENNWKFKVMHQDAVCHLK